MLIHTDVFFKSIKMVEYKYCVYDNIHLFIVSLMQLDKKGITTKVFFHICFYSTTRYHLIHLKLKTCICFALVLYSMEACNKYYGRNRRTRMVYVMTCQGLSCRLVGTVHGRLGIN